MGSSRHYLDQGARLAGERELREAMRHGPLQPLSVEQIAAPHANPLTIAPERSRMLAKAWL